MIYVNLMYRDIIKEKFSNFTDQYFQPPTINEICKFHEQHGHDKIEKNVKDI